MSYYDNVYYSPEKYGLTQIDSLHDPEACWSFHDLVVWQHEDGRIFYGTDAGCSCPSPFDNIISIDQLTEVTRETFIDFCDAVDEHCNYEDDSYSYYKGDYSSFLVEKVEVKRKVAELLR